MTAICLITVGLVTAAPVENVAVYEAEVQFHRGEWTAEPAEYGRPDWPAADAMPLTTLNVVTLRGVSGAAESTVDEFALQFVGTFEPSAAAGEIIAAVESSFRRGEQCGHTAQTTVRSKLGAWQTVGGMWSKSVGDDGAVRYEAMAVRIRVRRRT